MRLVNKLQRRFPGLVHHPNACATDPVAGPVGHGSCGIVDLATLADPATGRVTPVAKKIFNDNAIGILECNNYVGLDHPHIVKCLGFTATAGRAPTICLIMELGCGSFQSRFVSGAVTFRPAEIRDCALQIAHALAYLHSRNLVHLDVKPENVIIFESDSNGAHNDLKLGDLGSAKPSNQSFDFISATTRYAPPEFSAWMASFRDPTAISTNNNPFPVSATFDVYCLGVIIFRMLRRSHQENADHALLRRLRRLARRCRRTLPVDLVINCRWRALPVAVCECRLATENSANVGERHIIDAAKNSK